MDCENYCLKKPKKFLDGFREMLASMGCENYTKEDFRWLQRYGGNYGRIDSPMWAS